jgi:hypothetical protein
LPNDEGKKRPAQYDLGRNILYFRARLWYNTQVKLKGKAMRRKNQRKAILLNVFFMLAMVICPWNALGGALVGISSVEMIPSLPTETDSITFDVNGWASQAASWVEYDVFSQDGSSLQLDLYIDTGDLFAPSSWTYSKPISALPANSYTLEINAYDYDDSSLDDTYIVEFTVVPEPATIAFLGIGLCLFRSVFS